MGQFLSLERLGWCFGLVEDRADPRHTMVQILSPRTCPCFKVEPLSSKSLPNIQWGCRKRISNSHNPEKSQGFHRWWVFYLVCSSSRNNFFIIIISFAFSSKHLACSTNCLKKSSVWFFHPSCGVCSSFVFGWPIVGEVITNTHPRKYEVGGSISCGWDLASISQWTP